MPDDMLGSPLPPIVNSPIVERRGLDAAVIALIKQLHEQFVEAHSHVHETFVASHEREHNLRTDATEEALDLAAEKLKGEVVHLRGFYDAILAERDTRYEERFQASQLAITAAFDAREKALLEAFEAREKALQAALESKDKAVQAAFESSEKAIQKAEISIEKRADATYVALGELQRLLSQLMPRAEAENRFGNQDSTITDLRDRVKGMESIKIGGQEVATQKQQSMSGMYAAAGVIVAILAIVITIILSNPGP